MIRRSTVSILSQRLLWHAFLSGASSPGVELQAAGCVFNVVRSWWAAFYSSGIALWPTTGASVAGSCLVRVLGARAAVSLNFSDSCGNAAVLCWEGFSCCAFPQVLIGCLLCIFWEVSVWIFCSLCNWVTCLTLALQEFFTYSGPKSFVRSLSCKHFLSILPSNCTNGVRLKGQAFKFWLTLVYWLFQWFMFFVSWLRNLCLTPRHNNFLLCFALKVLVLACICGSVIHC